MPDKYSFKHRVLGTVTGLVRGDDVVQFRGLPYEPYDATLPGPICPQLQGLPFPSFWEGPLPPDGLSLPKPTPDEFNCLNLNITIPRAVVDDAESKTAPVLVFIHGGGFTVGSQSIQVSGREIYDGLNPVRHGMATGREFVNVTLNYRVGPLGFLASSELQAYNKSHDEPVGNYGLHDQVRGLEWISKFISGFGGDPRNVTISGGSAGGASAHYLSTFPDPLFQRAIVASGSALGLGPMPMEFQQTIFDSFILESEKDSEAAVEYMQSVPVTDLVSKPIGFSYSPLTEGAWISQRHILLENSDSAPDIMVGSCTYEQDVFLAGFLDETHTNPLPDDQLRKKIEPIINKLGLISDPAKALSPDLLEAYGLPPGLDNLSQNTDGWGEFLADLIFRVPTLVLGQRKQGKKMFLYDFRAASPYPGWKLGYGKANHSITDMFFFNAAKGCIQPELEEQYEGAVKQLQDLWIDFCHGQSPWSGFGSDGKGQLGPIQTIDNGGTGREYRTVEEVVGEKKMKQWRAVLKHSDVP